MIICLILAVYFSDGVIRVEDISVEPPTPVWVSRRFQTFVLYPIPLFVLNIEIVAALNDIFNIFSLPCGSVAPTLTNLTLCTRENFFEPKDKNENH